MSDLSQHIGSRMPLEPQRNLLRCEVGASGSRNPIRGIVNWHSKCGHFGSAEQLQSNPSSDLATVHELDDLIVDRLRITNIAIAAEAVLNSKRICSCQVVAITHIKVCIIALDVSRLDKTKYAVRSRCRD